jgi:hypothetical protein
MTALEYNNKIVDEQNKIITKILAFYDATAAGSETSEKLRKEASEQCESSLKVIKALPDYEGDTRLRDAAVELLLFYQTMADKSFVEMMAIIEKGEEITDEDLAQLEKIEADITNKEVLLDAELANAQEAFSKKHNVTLVDNEIQQKIDALDTE